MIAEIRVHFGMPTGVEVAMERGRTTREAFMRSFTFNTVIIVDRNKSRQPSTEIRTRIGVPIPPIGRVTDGNMVFAFELGSLRELGYQDGTIATVG